MTLNAADLIASNIRKLSEEYTSAEAYHDSIRMSDIALEIASLYTQLCSIQPERESTYNSYTEFWERKAVATDTRKNTIPAETVKVDKKHFADTLKFKPTIHFQDIGGYEKLKSELRKTAVLSEVKGIPGFKPANILLYGPPGTGKTLMANALATELQKSDVYYNASLEDLLSKYYGEASKNISNLYDGARQNSKRSIIFLDEVDALGSARTSGGENSSNNQVVTTLLTELDGTKSKNNPEHQPLTIGACNHPWDVDNAILSRFRKRIYVGLPDADAVSSILKTQLKGYAIDSSVNLDKISRECVSRYYSGRDLEGFCTEAIGSMIERSHPNFDTEFLSLSGANRDDFRLRLRPLTMDDLQIGFEKIRSPLTKAVLERYEEWNNH